MRPSMDLETRFLIRPSQPFDLRKTVRSHGWVHLAPFGWSEPSGTLSRVDQFAGGLATTSVKQVNDGSLAVDVFSRNAATETDVYRHVSRMLMLEWDQRPVLRVAQTLQPSVARFIEAGGGRFLRGTSLFEDFAKTVCTINTSWACTVRMVERLVNEFGGGAFPSAQTIAATPEAALRAKARVGYRARTLVEGARVLTASGNPEEDPPTREEFLDVPGIGPYAADHMMILAGNHSRIPVDSEVLHYCRQTLAMSPGTRAEDVQSHFDDWGEHRFIGYKVGRILRKANWIG
jgi:3-methyladenine DNA glycosylase/8-oxoguanine DNA glycosylase